jgi:outer membrane protein assembly factor BamD (BamD/ComL family)
MHSTVRRHGLGYVFAFLAVALIAAPAVAQTRVALVIGNSTYRSVPVLPNPAHDAGDIAASFERLGFSVRHVTDATYDDMRKALLEFSQKARSAEMAVVFFAGHGMEVGGENWLIPVDAELKTDLDTEQEAISLRGIMLMVSATSKLGLVVLDACRNNPFLAKMKRTVLSRSVARGLSQIEPTSNVLVAYAARDGTTAADGNGRNSPFTTALLKYLETPGLEINFLFRNVRDDVILATASEQQPFVYGSLSKEAIYLKAPPATLALPGPDEVTWSFLKETTNEAELKRFTDQYPNSPLRKQAEARIAALLAAQAVKPVPPKPDEITWSLLKETTDEAALKRFTTQYPSSPLRQQAEARIAALLAAQAAKPVPPKPDEVTWSLLKETTDEAALKRFTAQYPSSPLRQQAEARIAALLAAQAAKPVPPKPDEVTWSLLKETTDEAALKRFTTQYPSSPLRQQAETRIAVLAAAQAAKPVPIGPDEVTWSLLKETTDDAALKRFLAQYPGSPLRQQAEARIAALAAALAAKPVPPSPDEITWTLLKETTDELALKRFTAQYPASPLRPQAEARIAALAAAPVRPTSEDVAWGMVKDSKDPDQLRRFVDQFPKSAKRDEAEQRVAALTAEPAKSTVADPLDRHEMARQLQMELKRVGCFDGAADGEFSNPTRTALRTFARFTMLSIPDDLSLDALKAVRGIDKRICPLVCQSGERAEGDRCVHSSCPSGQVLKNGTCIASPSAEPQKRAAGAGSAPNPAGSNHPSPAATAAPKTNGKCFSFQGRQFCE